MYSFPDGYQEKACVEQEVRSDEGEEKLKGSSRMKECSPGFCISFTIIGGNVVTHGYLNMIVLECNRLFPV